MSTLVSVVIPTFNRAHCVDRAIDSVVTQTHRDVEVIVVDDGSTDSTRDLIERRYGDDRRIRYHHQQNGGVCAARNAGLRASRGDYIALLDSDDAWKPWKLELQLACLKKLPHVGMIWTDMEAIDTSGKVINPYFLREMYSAYRWFTYEELFTESHALPATSAPVFNGGATLYAGDIYSQMILGNLVHTSTVLLRRERAERVRGFNEALRYSGEDHDFHLRTCREGPVAFANVSSIAYRWGAPDQLTREEYDIYRARNFLITIATALEADRDRIRLPKRMIGSVLAEAHRWIGEAALDIEERREARRHLFLSLKEQWHQPRVALQLAVTLLPRSVDRGMRSWYRRLRAMLASGRSGGTP